MTVELEGGGSVTNREFAVLQLHKPIQYRKWQRWLQMAVRNRLAFYDNFCTECSQAYPCRTAQILTRSDKEDPTGSTDQAAWDSAQGW